MGKMAWQELKDRDNNISLGIQYMDWLDRVKLETTSCYYKPGDDDDRSLNEANQRHRLNR